MGRPREENPKVTVNTRWEPDVRRNVDKIVDYVKQTTGQDYTRTDFVDSAVKYYLKHLNSLQEDKAILAALKEGGK